MSQICNWFANWRRKLKNAGSEAPHRTWGNLIKSYNNKAQGNVEQFSLCSDDSIWEEQDMSDRGNIDVHFCINAVCRHILQLQQNIKLMKCAVTK
jgi:hypothetical protein